MIEASEDAKLRPAMADWIASRIDCKVYETLAFRDPRELDVADKY